MILDGPSSVRSDGAVTAACSSALALSLIIMMLPAPALAGSALPKGFVYLRDVDPTILQDIRYAGSHNFVGRPIRGYLAAECILSVPAANALATVQRRLAEKKLSLIVWDCYRPKRAVDDFLAVEQGSGSLRNEDRILSAHRQGKAVRAWLSRNTIGALARQHGGPRYQFQALFSSAPPPDPSQPPKACTAPKGERFEDGTIDFGTGYDCLDVLANTSNALVGGIARDNRQMLKILHEGCGLSSLCQGVVALRTRQ